MASGDLIRINKREDKKRYEETQVSFVSERVHMKKKGLFRITAAALMTAMALSVIPSISSEAYTETKATVVPASAKIRESAGSSSNVLGSAVKGTEVTIVDEAKDDAGTLWYKVNVNGNTGYIRSDLVTAAAADSADNSDAKADDTKATDTKATDAKADDAKADDTQKTADAKTDDTQKTTTATNTATTIDGTQIDLSAITLPDGVTGADAQYISVNVTNGKIRSDASTKADIVDTLVKGSTLVALGTKSDDSGKSWYYTVFTGNDGSQKNGYIRSDLITAGDVLPKADTTETTEATETTEETTAAANNDYQLVYADDGSGSGTSTWFLYDNKNGTRMKADELMEYVSAQPAKEKENETALKQYRMIIISLGVVAIAFLIGLIILGIKLREADYEYDPDDDDDDDDRPERPRRSATGRDNDTRRDGGDREDDDRRRMRESEDRSRRRMQADSERSKRKDSDEDDDVRPLRRSRVSEDRPVRRTRDDEDRPRRSRDEDEERPARRVRPRDEADRSARSRDDADRPVRTRDNADRPARARDDEERPVRTRENSDISRASRESDARTRRSSYDDQDAEDQAGTENSRARKARNFISDETDDLDFEFINVDDKNDK